MKVSVLLFARYRELAGRETVEVEVPAGSTLASIWSRVQESVPALKSEGRPLMACDRAYVGPDRVIEGGEEIAAFPSVSGG